MNIERVLPLSDVRAWVIESLRDPLALSFSHHVASTIDWSGAQCRVLVSSDVPHKEVLDFRSGGKSSGEPSPDEWLLDALRQVRTSNLSFVLIEDWSARPADTFIRAQAMPLVHNGDEVYYVVDNTEPHLLSNWPRICSNSVPLFHGFVIQGLPMPKVGSTIGRSSFEVFSQGVKMAFFGIYDGESYLTCTFR